MTSDDVGASVCLKFDLNVEWGRCKGSVRQLKHLLGSETDTTHDRPCKLKLNQRHATGGRTLGVGCHMT